ncbi:MAG: alpha/beta fold hydrolase [Bacteroidota bacterium]
MKSNITFLLFFCIHSFLLGQNLTIEAFEFVSRAKDTVQAELGTFQVLEERSGEQTDSIQLSFVRFKSTNPNPASPIVYLSGGPGGSGTGTAKGRRFELFMKLRAVADVIAFDQRGTGMSEKLPVCPHNVAFELDRAIDKAEYVEKTTEGISRCLEFWEQEQVNLTAYNTTESAKDIDDLRRALGVDKISLWGISYGSHLAFEYIRLFEEHLDKVVLASLEGPNETVKLPIETEKFVHQIAEKAKENYGSDVRYPNLKEKIIAVHDRVKKAPVTASYQNRSGGRDTVVMSLFELQAAIATFYLKNPWNSKKLPKAYSQMYEGDFSAVAPDVMVMKRYIFNGIRPMSFAMDMQGGISEERKALVEQQIDNTILGSCINFLLYEWMTKMDFPQLADDFRTLPPNQVDALLLSGDLDGRTYLSDAINIAQQFENGQHVVIENAGHDLFMSSPVVGDMILRFFQDKTLNIDRIRLSPTTFD